MAHLRLASDTTTLPAGEAAYRVIRQAILDLGFEPGAALSENALAAQLGTSRTPIREALQRLQREGLIFVLPQRGTIVAPLNFETFRAAYFVRASLESCAAAEAARISGKAAQDELEDSITRQRVILADWDEAKFWDENNRFHQIILRHAGVPGVWQVVQDSKFHLDRMRRAHLDLGPDYRFEAVVAEHAAITDAIARGDVAAASGGMHEHIAKVLPRVELLKAARPELFEAEKPLTQIVGAEVTPRRRSLSNNAAGKRGGP